jgi:hypothetical protein
VRARLTPYLSLGTLYYIMALGQDVRAKLTLPLSLGTLYKSLNRAGC